jgi:peptidoglycan/xylan/chitin deacetylase (PgdA/CDA1 family)
MNARTLAEAGLVRSGIARWQAHRRRGRTLVLAYHNIVPDDVPAGGDRSLHLPRAMFARQLDVLGEWCDVVPLSAILAESPPDARPRVAITFDDAYHGALTLGALELRARHLPATMFAAPGLLGTDAFWWDTLAGQGGLADSVREHALTALRGDGAAIRRWATQTGHPVSDPPAWRRPGLESELLSWTTIPGCDVGAHTWRHANLARLTVQEVEAELREPLAWLRDRASARLVPWLTYPYGLANPDVRSAARKAGYGAGLAVAGGWMQRRVVDPYWLPRLNVPAGLTIHGFRLRLAGIVGSVVASTQHIGKPIEDG